MKKSKYDKDVILPPTITISKPTNNKENSVDNNSINNLNATLTLPKLENNDKSSFFRSYRFLIVLLLMLNFFSTTSVRMNLGMAIVCMVNTSTVKLNLPKQG